MKNRYQIIKSKKKNEKLIYFINYILLEIICI